LVRSRAGGIKRVTNGLMPAPLRCPHQQGLHVKLIPEDACLYVQSDSDFTTQMLLTCKDGLPARLTLGHGSHAAVGATAGRRACKSSSQVSCRGLIQYAYVRQ